MVTPHVYLFDKNGDLRYRGAIDDGPKRVKRNYLVDAINSVSKGKSVRTKTTKSLGCSIKY
jgi:hypothetical protein